MRYAVFLLVLVSIPVLGDDYKGTAITLSIGNPGLVIPELGLEFAVSSQGRIGISAGTFFLYPEFRLIYMHMIRSLELAGGIGYVPGSESDSWSGIFENIFSLGTNGCAFATATVGYRHTADGGFIFRVLGGGGLFAGSDNTEVLPFLQLGIGYGF